MYEFGSLQRNAVGCGVEMRRGIGTGFDAKLPPWFPAEVTSPPRIKAADAIGSDSGVRSGDPRVRAGLGNPSLWRWTIMSRYATLHAVTRRIRGTTNKWTCTLETQVIHHDNWYVSKHFECSHHELELLFSPPFPTFFLSLFFCSYRWHHDTTARESNRVLGQTFEYRTFLVY